MLLSYGSNPPSRTAPAVSRTLKIIGLSVLLAALAGAAWFYQVRQRNLKNEAYATLAAIAKLKVEQLVSWRTERLADAEVITRNPMVCKTAVHHLAAGSRKTREALLTWFQSLGDQYHYQSVLLADTAGNVRLSYGTKKKILGPEALATFAEACQEGRPIMSDLHALPDGTTPHFELVAPLFDSGPSATRLIGAVIMRYDAAVFLFPYIQAWPIPGRTSETLLIRREHNSVLFLNELRHLKNTALNLRIPLSRIDVPAVMAVQGKTGAFQGKDYRGVAVLSILSPVPGTPWHMVTKIDEDEAFAARKRESLLLIAVFIGILMSILAAIAFFLSYREKEQFRVLHEKERAIRLSEGRYRTTLLSVGDGVITTDAQGRVALLNPVAEKLTGWSDAEAKGRPLEEVFNIIKEETREKVENPATRVLREGCMVGPANHTLLIGRHGTEHPIADSGAPIQDDQSGITGVVLVFRDQSEERRAEFALQENEKRYRVLFESGNDAIYIHPILENGEAGRFTEVNQAACQMLGYSREELLLLSPQDFDVPDATDRRNQAIEALKNEGRIIFETKHRTKSGQPIPVEINARVFTFEGRPMVISIVRDISERAHAEKLRIKAEAEKEKMEAEKKDIEARALQARKMEAIGQLAGGVAHDFNNLLFAIVGFCELLKRDPLPPPVQNQIQRISETALKGGSLTRQLLAFARKGNYVLRLLDARLAVSNVVHLLKHSIDKRIILEEKNALDAVPIMTDSGQLENTLLNLGLNARDAMPRGGRLVLETGVAVLTEEDCRPLTYECNPGPYAVLTVSDTGTGMDKETQLRIFEPFFTTKEPGKGTGLGLSSVYGFVKQMEGYVHVYSEKGQGSVFKIYLPLASGVLPIEEPEVVQDVVREGHILLVEDEPGVRMVGQRLLEGLGYRVTTCENGVEALHYYSKEGCDINLVILDLIMPEMGGRDCFMGLRKINSVVRVIISSGFDIDGDIQELLDHGAMGFLQKPYRLESISPLIDKILSKPC